MLVNPPVRRRWNAAELAICRLSAGSPTGRVTGTERARHRLMALSPSLRRGRHHIPSVLSAPKAAT
jgi:hypothetical protein